MRSKLNRVVKQLLIAPLCVVAVASAVSHEVLALPFNDDMVQGQNMPAGKMARAKVPESVPLGSGDRYTGNREGSRNLKNPVAADIRSIAAGERLYQINCVPCHGTYVDGAHVPGTVSQYLPGPALGMSFYADKAAYPDGHYYQFIRFGGLALMPAYGYKLSETEHWDIVNYIRHFQSQVASK